MARWVAFAIYYNSLSVDSLISTIRLFGSSGNAEPNNGELNRFSLNNGVRCAPNTGLNAELL